MKGFSALLTLALAAAVSASSHMWSEDCSRCPPCLTEASPVFYYPIEDQCSFCRCDNGTPTTEHCPDGMGWDAGLEMCVPRPECRKCCDGCCANGCDLCYHGIDYPMPDPNDKCKYCLCAGEGGIYPVQCPPGYRFNKSTLDCDILDPDCGPPPTCPGVVCNMTDGREHHFPNLNDPSDCSFCCCLPNDPQPQVRICPFHEKYQNNVCDESTKEQCKDVPPKVHAPRSDCCVGITCPVNPNRAPLYPCPGDDQSFCQCDWGGKVHQMPCQPGSTFNMHLQTCL